jgi:hypothetical protein
MDGMRPSRPGWTARSLTRVINCVLAGVGAVFMITGSVVVTALAAFAALSLTMTIVLVHRGSAHGPTGI